MKVYGIDGCPVGWLLIGFGPGDAVDIEVLTEIDALAPRLDGTRLVLVDIPIGLPSAAQPARECDVEARRMIRPRGSSVFPAPSRAALAETDYRAGSEANQRAIGRRLSKQSWNISPKIREIDEFVRRTASQDRFREMHPEVAFAALNAGVPMAHGKKTSRGFAERLALLERERPGAADIVARVRSCYPLKRMVADDDILDAMVGAVTASHAPDLATLPAEPAIDDAGLRMEIVYSSRYLEPGGPGPREAAAGAGGERHGRVTGAGAGGSAAASQSGDGLRPETEAAQALHYLDPATGGVVPPIQPSTTFARDDAYRLIEPERSYARDQNPGYVAPERLLARLEGAADALLFSSGMAAAMAVVQSLKPGDHVVAPAVMYWGLRGWLTEFCATWGIALDAFDARDIDDLRAKIRPGQTRLVWIETPTNPTWDVTDIAAAASVAHEAGALIAVDSTVPTPVLTRPLQLGADIVMHSATKYLNGHGDVVAGALATRERSAFWSRVRTQRAEGGALLGSFEAWLLQRGMRTLYLRVRQASASALAIAEHFEGDPRLSAVLYPGLASHPGHAIAARQMHGGFGGMLSLRVKGGASAALAVANRCQVFIRATSLGGVESLIEHRGSIEGPDSPIPRDLLRLSVGVEAAEDLIADLDRALG